MNKPSERIVVFVTPAQKRAISATAEELGISISELMRRAVIAFSATGEQVRAASIVDRLNAPREPDALAQVLRKAARPLRDRRGNALKPAAADAPAHDPEPAYAVLSSPDDDVPVTVVVDETAASANGLQHVIDGGEAAAQATTESPAATLPSPLPATHDVGSAGSAAHEIGQAVARLSAQVQDAATVFADTAADDYDEPLQPPSGARLARKTHPHGDSDARHDGLCGGAPEDGKFA
jgi:hypothetical protein